ncbi:MAG: hypothetical protein HY897_14220 [Deltaproteobacteria bacterium]|nr:hypothetical protein [Deltaproteobacteria bacterium]
MEELKMVFTVLGSVVVGWALNEISYAFRERQKGKGKLNNALSILLPMRFSLGFYSAAKKLSSQRMKDAVSVARTVGGVEAVVENTVSMVSTNSILGWAKDIAVLFGDSAQKAVGEVGTVDPVLACELHCSVSAIYMFFGVEKKQSLELARIRSVLGIPDRRLAQAGDFADAPDVPDGVLVSFDKVIKAIARRAGPWTWLRVGRYLNRMSSQVSPGIPSATRT